MSPRVGPALARSPLVTGHAEQWTELTVVGDLYRAEATVRMKRGGKTLAVITVGYDRESLRAELAMERGASPPSRG